MAPFFVLRFGKLLNLVGMFQSLSDFKKEGLRYRALRKDDRSFFVELYSNVEKMTHVIPMCSTELAERLFKAINNEPNTKRFIWLVENSSEQLGFVGLSHCNKGWELGIVLKSSGTGLGRKVMMLLLSEVFSTYPVCEVIGRIHVENKAAIKSVVTLGFEYIEDINTELQLWLLKKENFINENG